MRYDSEGAKKYKKTSKSVHKGLKIALAEEDQELETLAESLGKSLYTV